MFSAKDLCVFNAFDYDSIRTRQEYVAEYIVRHGTAAAGAAAGEAEFEAVKTREMAVLEATIRRLADNMLDVPFAERDEILRQALDRLGKDYDAYRNILASVSSPACTVFVDAEKKALSSPAESLRAEVHDIKNKVVAATGLVNLLKRVGEKSGAPYEAASLQAVFENGAKTEAVFAKYLSGQTADEEIIEYLRENIQRFVNMEQEFTKWFEAAGSLPAFVSREPAIAGIRESLEATVARTKALLYTWLGRSMTYDQLRVFLARTVEYFGSVYPVGSLRLEITPNVPHNGVFTYFDMIRTHLEEVLYNAWKYGDRREIAVHAEVARGNELEIRVVNTGRPLSRQELKDIFVSGSRCEGTEGVEGYGLGLPAMRRDIEIGGGRILTHSHPRGMVSIGFRLPLNGSVEALP